MKPEGKSQNLTIPFNPLKHVITYACHKNKQDFEKGICNIGPIITVNTTGIITECDASIENQEKLYNYGNVLTDLIENICIKNGAPILKPRKLQRVARKLINKYYFV